MIHNRRLANNFSKGFTLLEILIATSLIGVLSAVSIASFVTFSRSQQLQQATNGVLAAVKQAKSHAQSQVKPDSCQGKVLEGYRVEFCSSQCPDPNSYEIQVRCGGENYNLNDDDSSFHLSNASIAQTQSLIFHIQGNSVTKGQSGQESVQEEYYDITVTNPAGEKTVRVTNYGSISVL